MLSQPLGFPSGAELCSERTAGSAAPPLGLGMLQPLTRSFVFGSDPPAFPPAGSGMVLTAGTVQPKLRAPPGWSALFGRTP